MNPSFQRHRTGRVFVGLCLALLAAAAVGSAGCEGGDSSAESPAGTRTVIHGTRYAMDLPTAIASADMIVMGTATRQMPPERGRPVTDAMRQRQRDAGWSEEQIDAGIAAYEDWIYTTSLFRVDQVLKGDGGLETIEIREAGGTLDGRSFEAPDRPRLLQRGRQVVFLVRAFDGPWGAIVVFKITGDTATTRDLNGEEYSLSVDELCAMIAEHKDDPRPWESGSVESSGNAGFPGPVAPPRPEGAETESETADAGAGVTAP